MSCDPKNFLCTMYLSMQGKGRPAEDVIASNLQLDKDFVIENIIPRVLDLAPRIL